MKGNIRKKGVRWAWSHAVAAVSILAAATANASPQDALSAADAWRKFALHPSFRIDLVAAEPAIRAPDAIAWDARERAWLCSRGERILILPESTDGEASVFASGLQGVTSFVFHRDGLLVSDATGIAWLRDTDGDDRMDERVDVRRVPGRLDRLRWGIDGWLYAAYTKSDESPGDVASGLVRLRPDGSEFASVVALPGKLRGFDTTWDGEIFLSTDAAHAAHMVLPDAAFTAGRVGAAKGWVDASDHTYIERLRGAALGDSAFTQPGDSCVVEGAAWPGGFAGSYFVSEPKGGLIHRDELKASGVSFRALRIAGAEFLASADPLFRPTRLAVAPDGALWVLDRYADDARMGRVWRIQHTRAAHLDQPILGGATSADLMRALSSPNRWRRMTAQRLLFEHELAADARADLARLALETENEWLDLHALWLAPDSTELVRSCLSSYSPGVRRNALIVTRTLGRMARRVTASDVRAHVNDGAGRSELEALYTWSVRVDGPSHRELVELIPTLDDDWSRSLALALAAKRPTAFLSVALKHGEGDAFEELARLVSVDVGRRKSLRDAVAMVLTLREAKADARVVASVLRTLYTQFQSSAKPWPSPRIATVLRRLAEDEDPRIAAAALPLAHYWLGDQLGSSEVRQWSTRLHDVVADPAHAADLRRDALVALLEIPSERTRAAPLAEELGVVLALQDENAPPASMLDAMQAWLATLTSVQRDQVQFAFDGGARFLWPFEQPASSGLSVGSLDAKQRGAMDTLLRTVLTARGFQRVSDAIELAADPEGIAVSIFGMPGAGSPWAWRVGGKHLSLNFTVGAAGELQSATPMAIGAEPARVQGGERDGFALLGDRAQLARDLLESLDDEQRARAIRSDTAPDDVLFGPDRERLPMIRPGGLRAGLMTLDQRERLVRLARATAGDLANAPNIDSAFEGDALDGVHFVWMGEADSDRFYYRLQSDGVVIEYCALSADHVHAVLRDRDGDFARGQ